MLFKRLAGTMVVLSTCGVSQAGFMGSTLGITWEKPNRGSVWQGQNLTVQVGTGLEYTYRTAAPGGFAGFDFDVSDSTMRLTFQFAGPAFVYFTGENFNGLVLRDVANSIADFGSLTLGAASGGISNQGGVGLSVETPDTLVLNLSNLRGASSGDWVEFHVSFVPAPAAAVALMLPTLGRRRRT